MKKLYKHQENELSAKCTFLLESFFIFRYSLEECQIIRLENKEEFLIPGFIDTHIHAPQFPNNGKI